MAELPLPLLFLRCSLLALQELAEVGVVGAEVMEQFLQAPPLLVLALALEYILGNSAWSAARPLALAGDLSCPRSLNTTITPTAAR